MVDFNQRGVDGKLIGSIPLGVALARGDSVVLRDVFEGFEVAGTVVNLNGGAGVASFDLDWETLGWTDEPEEIGVLDESPSIDFVAVTQHVGETVGSELFLTLWSDSLSALDLASVVIPDSGHSLEDESGNLTTDVILQVA